MTTTLHRKHEQTQTGGNFFTQVLTVFVPVTSALNHWMSTRSLREQVLIKILGTVLGAYIVCAVAVTPALNSLAKSDLKAQTLQREWSQLLTLQSELKTLKSVAPISTSDASTSLQDLAVQLGPQCKIVIQDSTARLQIKGVSPEGLTQLFPQIRARSQAQVLETSLRLDTQTKLWEGSITLALPNSNLNTN